MFISSITTLNSLHDAKGILCDKSPSLIDFTPAAITLNSLTSLNTGLSRKYISTGNDTIAQNGPNPAERNIFIIIESSTTIVQTTIRLVNFSPKRTFIFSLNSTIFFLKGDANFFKILTKPVHTLYITVYLKNSLRLIRFAMFDTKYRLYITNIIASKQRAVITTSLFP